MHKLQESVTYRPIDILSIFVQGNKLLNRSYDFYYGVAAPRRQVMGGVAITVGDVREAERETTCR